MWLSREDYKGRIPPRSRWFSQSRWLAPAYVKQNWAVLKSPDLSQPLWRSYIKEKRKKRVFLQWVSMAISPAAYFLEWPPKPWHQPTRSWSYALLKPSEWLGILSGCTSGTCSWTQNFPVDSGTGYSVRAVCISQLGGVTAHPSSEGTSHFINTCSLRQKEPLLHLGKESEIMMKFNEQVQHSEPRCLSGLGWCFLSRGEQGMTECD